MNLPEEENVYVIMHCLLNSSVRVKGIRKPEPFDAANKKIIQLPCPELIFAGPDRDKKVKEDYDTPKYRDLCRDLFLPFADMIEMLSEEGNKIIIAGVSKSPSCGVLTTTAKNGVIEGQGVFFEEIEKELKKRGVSYLITE